MNRHGTQMTNLRAGLLALVLGFIAMSMIGAALEKVEEANQIQRATQ